MKYAYRINIAFPLFIALLILLIPFARQLYEVYTNPYYYVGLALVLAVPLIWYSSKFLIMDDESLKLGIFWGLIYRTVRYEAMEEAYEGSRKSASGIFPIGTEPFSGIAWFGNRFYMPTLKILISKDTPLLLNLRAIKKGGEVLELIEKRVRFVR